MLKIRKSSRKKEKLLKKYNERLQMEYNFTCLKANYDNIINYINYYPELRGYYANWLEKAQEIMNNFVEELDQPSPASFSVGIVINFKILIKYFIFFRPFLVIQKINIYVLFIEIQIIRWN
jgi:hypothetical protein